LLERVIGDAPGCDVVIGIRFYPAVVNSEFLEIGKDGERQFRAPRVTPELIRGAYVVFDVDRGFFRLKEEFSLAAHAEGVVGGL